MINPAERHRAKMNRKVFVRQKPPMTGFTPVEGKKFAADRLKVRLTGGFPSHQRSQAFLRPTRHNPSINRHTGKPHAHAREIARHRRQAAA